MATKKKATLGKTKRGKSKVKNETAALYICDTCGSVTTEKGHLCSPRPISEGFICQSCGVISEDPRHLCLPLRTELEYVCDDCGRAAVSDEMLCNPKKLKGATKKAKKIPVKG